MNDAHSRWGILADDLTGALDVASQFAAAGFSVNVVMDMRYRAAFEASLVVLSTSSRNDSADVARRKVQRAVNSLVSRKIPLIYKKIDSTCKGNLVAEIFAVCEATRRSVILCPANPAQGRYVREGLLFVRENCQQDLQELLQTQGCQRFERLRAPLSAVQWKQEFQSTNRILLADAATDSDMECLVQLAFKSPETLLLVGSAGLARPYAKLLASQEKSLPRPAATADSMGASIAPGFQGPGERPCLLFIGSTNPVTQRQVDVLVQAMRTDVCACNRAGAAQARRAIESHRHALVQVPIHQKPDSFIRKSIDQFVPLLRSDRVGSVLLSGGDTAAQVCKSLKPHAIRVLGELLPGLACGKFAGGVAGGTFVCTKPGGFGDDASLLKAVRLMTAKQ